MLDHTLAWVHLGDLHIRQAHEENYLDLLDLIDDVNRNLANSLDFAFLPGDNAENGSEPQYALVQSALGRLRLPVHIIAGDHDRQTGSLDLFRQFLSAEPYHAITLKGFRLLFLNALDGPTAKHFDFSPEQLAWLWSELEGARIASLRPVVFSHLYPSELSTQARQFTRLIRDYNVELVEMGHTHYNELANDGRTVYATTRSTGQIEEGGPGFSITCIDGDVISWKFFERGQQPRLLITCPADQKLITRPASPNHVVRRDIIVRAKLWPDHEPASVTISIDGAPAQPMNHVEDHWQVAWDSLQVPDGPHRLTVQATTPAGEAQDEITILVNQSGHYAAPLRNPLDHANAVGAWPSKGILGTQLGPNKNGTKGPWPSWRNR